MRGLFRRRGEQGVTLVELLVTIVLVAIFFALAVPLFVMAQIQGSGDRARLVAANVAQSEIEGVRATKYADLAEETTTTVWPNDLGGPVKTYNITRVVTDVHQTSDPSSAVIYKMVTVDVSWTPPPKPVKHVVLTTAIYPQYRGPEIVNMTVTSVSGLKAEGQLIQAADFPLTISAQVKSADLSQTAYVRLTVTASNGSFATYLDVPAADAADGWFSWVWDGAGAGDGDYTFAAVAVSTGDKLGEYWTLHYPIDRGGPAAPTLLASGVQAGNHVISVSWSPPSPVAGDLAYYVLRFSDGRPDLNLNKASNTFIDRNLAIGTYGYTVFAVDERGQASELSATQSATLTEPADITPPSSPTGLTAALLGQDVTLSWAKSADPGVVAYRVYRSDVGANSPVAVIQTSASSPSYSFIDPQIGWGLLGITYSVTAVDAALNESAATTTQPVNTPEAPPQNAFGLTVKVTGHDAIVMVASLVTGYVYDINGQRVVDDRSVSPILVRSNQKQGQTFSNLYYSTYRVTVTPVDSRRNPIGPSVKQDVELVRNDVLTFSL